MSEGLTKKQFKELRKLEKMQSRNLEQKNSAVKWIAVAVVSVLFLGLFLGIIVVAKNKNKPTTADGSTVFAQNGHERIITTKKTDSTNSADSAQPSISLVEYGDFQCPACKTYEPIVNSLLEAFPDQLKLIFKNFPLSSLHPNAMGAAIAAEAANKQGKYFEYFDLLYEKQGEWSVLPNPDSKFEEYAKGLGIDVVKFKKDLKDPAITTLIEAHRAEGITNGVTGTPTFFLNGNKLTTPVSLDEFKKVIAGALTQKKGNVKPDAVTPPATKNLPLQE